MIHYTCDRCHREIDGQVEVRYQVHIKTNAASAGPESPVIDDDTDHLLTLHELLEEIEGAGGHAGPSSIPNPSMPDPSVTDASPPNTHPHKGSSPKTSSRSSLEPGSCDGREHRSQSHEFDLCADCFKIYSRNPLARDVPLSIEFSTN